MLEGKKEYIECFNEIKETKFWEEVDNNEGMKITKKYLELFDKLTDLVKIIRFNENVAKKPLYKYNSFDKDEYNIENLKNKKFFLRFAKGFNDLYDSNIRINIEKICIDLHKSLREGLNISKDIKIKEFLENILENKNSSFIKEIEKMLSSLEFKERFIKKNFQQNIAVTCFSEKNNSILMWAHYADNNKGFCVEYDYEEIIINKNEQFLPVIYDQTIKDVSDYFPYSKTTTDSNIFTHVMIALSRICVLSKSSEWEYENEWRLYRINANENGKDTGIKKEAPIPKAIYLGARISLENKEKILNICKEQKIRVFQMIIKEDEYQMFPVEIKDISQELEKVCIAKKLYEELLELEPKYYHKDTKDNQMIGKKCRELKELGQTMGLE